MTERSVEFLVRRCRGLAVLCLCSVVIPVYWLRHARIDNSIEVWTGTRDRAHQVYRQFLDKYGNEEFTVIAGEAQDSLSETALAFQKDLASRLRQIEQVDGVLDIAQAAAAFEKYGSEDWKAALQGNGLFRNLLLGEDGRTFGVIAWLRKIDNPRQRKLVVEQIESAVDEVADGRMQVHLAGTPLLNVALDRGSQEASRRILPAALAVSLVILAVVLRRIAGVVAVICAVGVTTLWTTGLMALSARTFNMVTVTLPSLLTVLSLSAGIHIVLRIQSLLAESGGHRLAVRRTVREVLPAIFLSNVTTAMIAGVAIGIAVDDTFHFFSLYREAIRSGQDSSTAIFNSFHVAGRAILFTSLVATVGFVILLLAQFRPIQYFGLLAGVTMIAASAADFLVLPACVALVDPWNGRGHKT